MNTNLDSVIRMNAAELQLAAINDWLMAHDDISHVWASDGEDTATSVIRVLNALEADAKLGRMVRHMPGGANLYRFMDRVDGFMLETDSSVYYGITPEDALGVAGVSI